MIRERELEERIAASIRVTSGLKAHRAYLGMSHVANKCVREAYRAFVDGQDMTDFRHRMCAVGYLFEEDVMRRLTRMGIAHRTSRELVADFDDRLRGHVDGETNWGDLLEIKSVTSHKFEIVCGMNRVLREHYDQVQLYMHFGAWQYAWVIYVNRETYEHKVIRVSYSPEVAEKLVARARAILRAIDTGHSPECECGKCVSTDFEADKRTGTEEQ